MSFIGLVINDAFTAVLPLSMPSKRVTLSNVPPFVKDELLVNMLSRYGKLVSPIKKNSSWKCFSTSETYRFLQEICIYGTKG